MNKSILINRISNDMKEIEQNPLEGIGIVSIENDPMKYVINMMLMTGPYKGFCIQLIMTIPENFPINPPKILIYPNQFIPSYHHHIFNDYQNGENYGKFCIDLLENSFMSTNEAHTGWNPAYSLSSILLQVQNFISDPDLHYEPTNMMVNNLMSKMKNYSRSFKVIDDQGERTIVHTWNNPYPQMYFKSKTNNNEIINNNKLQLIKENLTCYMLKENYIDNHNIILGYPIVQTKSTYGNNKIELHPIPQLLSYEGFKAQTQSNNNNNVFSSMMNVKAANNEFFNNWLPIYVDNEHFNKNKETILNAIKNIKNEVSFNPSQIFDILPLILNKMIIGMFNGKSIISSAFIVSYFHYVLLFKKLCIEYEKEFSLYFNQNINLIRMNNYNVNKRIAPDIGNFFMLMFFSNFDMNSDEMKKIRNALFEEYFTRQMYWIFHGDECKAKMKELILQNPLNLKDEKVLDKIYLEKFENAPDFKMKYLDLFNKELHNLGIFNNVVNIISNDNNILNLYHNDKKEAKNQVKIRMRQSFKKLFNECSSEGKSKLKDLILDNLHFYQFFEIKLTLDSNYDSFKVVDQILEYNNLKNKDEILKFAYESQRGNQLLLITFFTLKKMEEKGFMEELEKNYGIFLDVDNFVNELKIKLNEIKSFKALYEYVGSEMGKDKTELELIIEGYRRAKKKRYIKDPNEIKRDNNKNNNNNVLNHNNNSNNNNVLNHNNNVLNHNNNFSNSYYDNQYYNNRNYNNYQNSYDNQYYNNENYYYHNGGRRGGRAGRGGRGRFRNYNNSYYEYY